MNKGWRADCQKCTASKFACDDHYIRVYYIGPLTAEKVFKENGIENMADMQVVMDAVEEALLTLQ